MSEEKRMLQVGDIVYRSQYGFGVSKHEIKRVTEKRAYIEARGNGEGILFRELNREGYVKEVGGKDHYFIDTPVLSEKWERVGLLEKISNVPAFECLSTDQLRRIVAIIEEGKTPVSAADVPAGMPTHR